MFARSFNVRVLAGLAAMLALSITAQARVLTMYSSGSYQYGNNWVNVGGANGAPGSNDNQNPAAFAYNDNRSSAEYIECWLSGFPTLQPGERITGVYVDVNGRYDAGTSSNRFRMEVYYHNAAGQGSFAYYNTPVWSQSSSDDAFNWRMGGYGQNITGLRPSWSMQDLYGLGLAVRRYNNIDPIGTSRARVNSMRVVITTAMSATGSGSIDGMNTDLAEITTPTESVVMPAAIELGAYPNPFNPSTMVRFDLPEAGTVRLNLYDMAGRLVRTLAEGMYPAGRSEVVLDGANMASGTYFVDMELADQHKLMKITLVK